MSVSKTIVISCAGMGSRLGLGNTKALVTICGKPLILHQLEMLQNYDDIRIVVGYQCEQVIETVLSYRKDVLFVLNHNYMNTGTGGSFSLAAKHAGEYIVSLDGDLLVHPQDMMDFLATDTECIGVCAPSTDEPWYVQTEIHNDIEYAKAFSQDNGQYEWTGLVQVKTARLSPGQGHFYPIVEPLLPIKVTNVRTREIDTVNDYHRAVKWMSHHYEEE